MSGFLCLGFSYIMANIMYSQSPTQSKIKSMAMNLFNTKIGLALGGGAAKGIAHVTRQRDKDEDDNRQEQLQQP